MRVRPGFGETLPALLRRTRGIPERRTLIGAGVVAVALVIAFLVLYDPLDGRTQRVHDTRPVFNTLYLKGVVEPVAPKGDELQRYEAHHGRLDLSVTVRPLRLPAYQGDVAGLLPVFMERHMRGLAARLPGFQVTEEGKARLNKAPGYQVAFTYGTARRPSQGRDTIVVPDQQPGVRDGVVVSLRQARGPHPPDAAGKEVAAAMRSAFRSFKYGADRDD
jgi:hypothetical protein